MKRLKKSSENKKFIVVVFYGATAVGKYTVAKEFQKQTGYKFFHNHQTYDIARSLFESGTIHIARLYENLRFTIFKEIAIAKLNTVTTQDFFADHVTETGLSHKNYMRKIESIIEKAAGAVYFVHLKANKDVLLKRVAGNSRKKFLKMSDPKVLWKRLNNEKRDLMTSAPVKNNLVIDNTKLSPKKVSDIVIKHFKIK